MHNKSVAKGECSMEIRSSSSLRNNYNAISAYAKQSQEPVFITVNGVWKLMKSERNCLNSERKSFWLKNSEFMKQKPSVFRKPGRN